MSHKTKEYYLKNLKNLKEEFPLHHSERNDRMRVVVENEKARVPRILTQYPQRFSDDKINSLIPDWNNPNLTNSQKLSIALETMSIFRRISSIQHQFDDDEYLPNTSINFQVKYSKISYSLLSKVYEKAPQYLRMVESDPILKTMFLGELKKPRTKLVNHFPWRTDTSDSKSKFPSETYQILSDDVLFYQIFRYLSVVENVTKIALINKSFYRNTWNLSLRNRKSKDPLDFLHLFWNKKLVDDSTLAKLLEYSAIDVTHFTQEVAHPLIFCRKYDKTIQILSQFTLEQVKFRKNIERNCQELVLFLWANNVSRWRRRNENDNRFTLSKIGRTLPHVKKINKVFQLPRIDIKKLLSFVIKVNIKVREYVDILLDFCPVMKYQNQMEELLIILSELDGKDQVTQLMENYIRENNFHVSYLHDLICCCAKKYLNIITFILQEKNVDLSFESNRLFLLCCQGGSEYEKTMKYLLSKNPSLASFSNNLPLLTILEKVSIGSYYKLEEFIRLLFLDEKTSVSSEQHMNLLITAVKNNNLYGKSLELLISRTPDHLLIASDLLVLLFNHFHQEPRPPRVFAEIVRSGCPPLDPFFENNGLLLWGCRRGKAKLVKEIVSCKGFDVGGNEPMKLLCEFSGSDYEAKEYAESLKYLLGSGKVDPFVDDFFLFKNTKQMRILEVLFEESKISLEKVFEMLSEGLNVCNPVLLEVFLQKSEFTEIRTFQFVDVEIEKFQKTVSCEDEKKKKNPELEQIMKILRDLFFKKNILGDEELGVGYCDSLVLIGKYFGIEPEFRDFVFKEVILKENERYLRILANVKVFSKNVLEGYEKECDARNWARGKKIIENNRPRVRRRRRYRNWFDHVD